MKKIIYIITLTLFSTVLFGCSSMYNADWSFQNWTKKKTRFHKYSDYESPAKEQDKVNVIFIVNGLDGYDIYDLRNSSDAPAIKYIDAEDTNGYEFPSKKIDFELVTPNEFKGKTVYSFYMRPEPHTIKFSGMAAAIINPGKTCTIYFNFNPQANKNYVFYFYKGVDDKGSEKCILKNKEIIYENGTYKYLPEDLN